MISILEPMEYGLEVQKEQAAIRQMLSKRTAHYT
jgi:hypothetical protein